jgi:polysaccharide biosynthesis transport protein
MPHVNPDRVREFRLSLKDYPKILLKRIWILVGIFVLGVGSVTALTVKMTPTFRATATVQIRTPNRGLDVGSGQTLLYGLDSEKYYQTQYMLLTQPSTIRTMVKYMILDSEDQPNPGFQEYAGMNVDAIARTIIGHVEVHERRKTEIVDISVEGTNPKVLHKVTNALVETFMTTQSNNLKRAREERIREFEERANDARRNMEEEEEAQKRFFQQHNLESQIFNETFARNQDQRTRFQERLDGVQIQIVDLMPVYDAVRKATEAGEKDWVLSLANNPFVRGNERICDIERDIDLCRAEKTGLLRTLNTGARDVVVIDERIARLETTRRMEMERLLRSVPDTMKGYEVCVEGYEKRIEAIEEDYRRFAGLKVTHDVFENRIKRFREQSARLFDRLSDLYTGGNADDATVNLVEQATEPSRPVRPNVPLNVGLSALLSALLGFGLILLLEHLDDTLMSKEEVDRLGDGIPFLGVIRSIRPAAKTAARQETSGSRGNTRQKDLFAVEQPKSTVAEDFRGVRTALSFGEGLDDDRVFLVTSSSPKEGKTTVTINLATVMAYSGLKTLLIDADLRKPRVHKSFGISNEVGLTNVIIGRGTPADCVRSPNIENLENLDLLTSGPIPPNPSELLGRPHLKEILRELMAQYDRILIDSPPLGAVTDAAVLGRVVDRTILVVKAGKTKRRLIENAIEQLETVKAKFAGIVLNDLRSTATRYYPGYYQYYYYSSYSYGGGDSRKKKGA